MVLTEEKQIILIKARKILDEENYDIICLKAKLCPSCGNNKIMIKKYNSGIYFCKCSNCDYYNDTYLKEDINKNKYDEIDEFDPYDEDEFKDEDDEDKN